MGASLMKQGLAAIFIIEIILIGQLIEKACYILEVNFVKKLINWYRFSCTHG